MTELGGQKRFKGALRPIGRPVKRIVRPLMFVRLRWVFLVHGIEGIQSELTHLPREHAKALRLFGASVAENVAVVGPLSIINAQGDFSRLTVEPNVHIGSEVFLDLTDDVRIEDGATVSMRSMIITHFDVGHGPLAESRPRATAPVRICAGAYVGAGAVVLHGVTIGPEAIVAAGAVVLEDVPPGAVVGGIPAKVLTARTKT